MSGVTSAAAPEVQARAQELGWIPPERFTGDAARFIDADVFIERGETVLPILKKTNGELRAELIRLNGELQKRDSAIEANAAAIEEMREHFTVETQKKVEQARKELKASLVSASREGDHEAVAEITEQMTQLNTAEKEAKEAAPPSKKEVQEYTPDPVLVEWQKDHSWYGKDKRRTALAMAAAQELREGGDTSMGRVFYDKVAQEVYKDMPLEKPPADKVEGNRGGGSGGGSGKRSFASLPPDAKEACNADARNFVGPNKRYKTNAEWQERYAEIYYQGEQ